VIILKEAYKIFNISEKLIDIVEKSEQELSENFKKVDEVSLENQAKILKAFNEAKISQMHFGKTTGYGYNDIGREAIEKVYSSVFKAEDALVRVQVVNGTHAIATTLKALLMPGDELLAITGTPYDTLCEVIGIKESKKSLKSYGIKYSQIDLLSNDDIDIQKVIEYLKCNKVKAIHIQRSRGYALRKAFQIEEIKKVIQNIRSVDKNVIIMVDNCYGEFVEEKEPTEVGADIIVGSLMKNLGAGIATSGAYIAGKRELIELCAERLTAPGVGKEIGPSLNQNTAFIKGLFFAPSVVASSVKTAVFASRMLEKLGYEVSPKYNEKRSDIVQTIKFGEADKLIKFCQGIQKGSPVDSNSIPEPWDMPGYTDKVIMAAGTFTQGSSIELSCDAPIRPPYIAFMQGGVTYPYGKLGVLKAINEFQN